ncbi:MAG: hypothetical protein IT381_23990 [Deltaproteobacteria bacterium]|nr:hypothetical protein [Deltaproteobacteria bacterium]
MKRTFWVLALLTACRLGETVPTPAPQDKAAAPATAASSASGSTPTPADPAPAIEAPTTHEAQPDPPVVQPDPPAPTPPEIQSFTADHDALTAGGSTTLRWLATGAVSLDGQSMSGTSLAVTPATTTTYMLDAETAAGVTSRTLTVTVVPRAVIASFTATPASIVQGASTTLSWNATGTVKLNGAAVAGTSAVRSPSATTMYTLSAANALGDVVTASRTVTVTTPPPPAGRDLFVDAYVNGWKKDNAWFSTYEITSGQIHLVGTAAWQGLMLSTTQSFAAATYERINITAHGSGTFRLEVGGNAAEIALTATPKVFSIPVASLWSGSVTAVDIKNVSASADGYFDLLTFGAPPPAPSCATPQPANPLSTTPLSVTTFAANGKTHWVSVPEDYDSDCHTRPKKLFVWLHGCQGYAANDINEVKPKASDEDWIALAVGGAEGACWSASTASNIVLGALAELKTRLAINDKEVILGGYSSGGDVGYPIIFKNSKLFALALFENTAPGNAQAAAALADNAAPPAGWRFPIRHLCHIDDEIASFKCSALRPILGPSTSDATPGIVKNKGHDSFLHEMDGTHYQADVNGRGTWADFHAKLRPYLKQTWTSP